MLPGSKTPTRASGGGTEDVSAWETMYFPANLGINMLYTTALLETEPATRARLQRDLRTWYTAGAPHLQGSFASMYLASERHHRTTTGPPPPPGAAADRRLHDVANASIQALLVDMASMGPGWKWMHATNRSADSGGKPPLATRPGVCFPMPCKHPQMVATDALLPSERPVAEYFWQRSPTVLAGGQPAVAHELPPIDGLLLYDIGRYAGAL